MSDRWSAVLQFGVAVLGWGIVLGYLLGRWRPLHRAREWAWWKVWVGKDPGRLRGIAIVALLPERFAPIIWHRIRHGAYPQRRLVRRPAPTPVLVDRPDSPDSPTEEAR